MHNFYIATVFAGALVCLLASLLLFARRKAGERSRVILAIIVLFSVFNYIPRFIALCNGIIPEFAVSAKLLLVANFMVISYIMYPIEVISPGWLNFRRVLKLYSIWIVLLLIYLVSYWAGLQYTSYQSLIEMIPDAARFEVWFRLLLGLLIFIPGLFIFFVYRTRVFNNIDNRWVKKYSVTLTINIVAYMIVLLFNHHILHTLYYYVSVGCSLYIVYMELFDRLIKRSADGNSFSEETESINSEESIAADPQLSGDRLTAERRDTLLIERLESYMSAKKAWRDPCLSLNTLASALFTNRTTLSQAMRRSGYENYSEYINRLRIEDFLRQIETGKSINFQDTFFLVGFRSRSTALRNFRQHTGMTPSEYLQNRGISRPEQ